MPKYCTIPKTSLQLQLQCCGIHNSSDWGTSRWYREGLGGRQGQHPRVVPKTCCVLQTRGPKSYLNPMPFNETSCQSGGIEEQRSARHKEVVLFTKNSN